jgi:hypothetical protein
MMFAVSVILEVLKTTTVILGSRKTKCPMAAAVSYEAREWKYLVLVVPLTCYVLSS